MQHILPFSGIKYELTMKRRLLSVFLALTMILLMLPEITTALAAINNGGWEGSGTEDPYKSLLEDGSGTYYSDLPTAIEVGTYTIWYRVVGDRNHFDVTDTKPVMAKIVLEDDSKNTGRPGGGIHSRRPHYPTHPDDDTSSDPDDDNPDDPNGDNSSGPNGPQDTDKSPNTGIGLNAALYYLPVIGVCITAFAAVFRKVE